ncbi:MAG: hypothetical protein JW787_11395 [Sedimentisphaerales bacterium]|nr:hypothetical protein [Sedimentisphaerales bacterium]
MRLYSYVLSHEQRFSGVFAIYKTPTGTEYRKWSGLFLSFAKNGIYNGNPGNLAKSKTRTNIGDVGGIEHVGELIATLVTSKDCAKCYDEETEQIMNSYHAHAG